MTTFHPHSARRHFLRQAAALGAATGTPFALNLSLIGAAAAQSATDHKALVCVFLNGGMDQSNAVVPYQGAEYNAYYAARPALARSQASLLPISPLGYGGPRLALASELAGLKTLFDQGQCAVMANVGLLTQPTSMAQFKLGTVRLPAGLYSHSDQSGSWQTGLPDRASATGWLGRVGDLTTAGYNQNLDLSICVSLAGNNAIQNGVSTVQHQLSTRGPILINTLNRADYRYNATQQPVLQRMLTEPRAHLLENAYTAIGARTIASNQRVSQALATAQPVTTPFPDSGLAAQLRMVARMIAARSALGQRRQIYFVSSGGWDMHDNLTTDHPLRLRELGDAVAAFHAATVELGVARQVTTFTASEFGRALQSNGRGTDHGWGSHHFVVGGAVAGNRIYGSFPTVAIGGPEDAGQGRLLPTTSVDQYAGALARWFGVPASMLSTVLPNLDRFEASNSAGLAFV